jgi:hypothetical protein
MLVISQMVTVYWRAIMQIVVTTPIVKKGKAGRRDLKVT